MKLKYVIIVLIALLSFSSCNDWLDVVPQFFILRLLRKPGQAFVRNLKKALNSSRRKFTLRAATSSAVMSIRNPRPAEFVPNASKRCSIMKSCLFSA